MSVKVKSIFRTTLLLCLLLVTGSVAAQTTAKGTVTDSSGEAVIGATVVEKGNPKNAAVTDFDGNFTLKLQKSKTIVVSYIGMIAQEVTATGGDLKIVMQDDNASLDEVVVVGYTSKARKDLTGSVGSITGAKLEIVPVSSAAEALQGKIAGVQITTTDGQPGADINIRIRGGGTSLTGNDSKPLFIVDGFQVESISDIPPSDIASIDVLKDASLTAIYGAKGGNGIVVVTTKSAKQGKVQVSFNGRLTTSALSRSMDLMDTRQFVDFQWERNTAGLTYSASSVQDFRNNFGNPKDLDLYRRAKTYDWQDEVLGNNPLSYSSNVSIGGGNESTKFNLSLTQSEDKGIVLASGVRRTNINLKLNTKLAKNLELTYNPKITYRRDEGAGGSGIGSGGLIDVLRYQPTAGIREWASYGDAERLIDAERFNLQNPVNDIQENTQKKHSYNIVNQASLKWTPIEGLMLRTEGNYNITFRDTQRYWGWSTSTGQQAVHQQKPVASLVNRTVESYTWTNTATYDVTVKENHNLSFLLGQEIYHSQYKEDSQAAHLFPLSVSADEAINNMALGEPYAADTYTLRSTADRTASFFGQATYNYDHKYYLAATLRTDGSTKFGPGNQWGYFPSVSGAWTINREKFLKDVKWIDQLKLRVSYGLSGNNNIGADRWRFLYSYNNSGGPGFGEATTNGELYYGVSSYYPNQDIKWETTVARNVAADISLFGGRLNITPEFYWNTTRDLLYQSPIPSVSGYTRQMQNIGRITNNGWELTVNGDILRGKDYVLSANFTLGSNKMVIKALNSTDNVLYSYASAWRSGSEQDYILQVGGELGLMYGYVYDGLYTWDEFTYPAANSYLPTPKDKGLVNGILVGGTATDADPWDNSNGVFATVENRYSTKPGMIKIKDLNGDGKITEEDKTVIGRTTPKFQGGFGFSGQWKDFDFVANFVYMLDFDVYNAMGYALSSSGTTDANTLYNLYAKFGDNGRWRYNDPSTGKSLYRNTYLDGQPGLYHDLNTPVPSLWNPADVTTNVMLSYFVEDGSFLRCSDVTIGYTLPKTVTQKLMINKIRAYVSASNLFILTGYSGYDPEVDVQSGLTPSMDYNRYPRARSFSFGLNVTF